MNSLKNCPFCGKPSFSYPTKIEEGWWTCSIICSSCPAQIIGGGDTKEEAVINAEKLWNRRI